MNRVFLVAIAAAALLGAGYAFGAGEEAASGDSTAAGVLLLSIMAIFVAIAGTAIGLYAALSARRTQADVARLTRSIDRALRDLAEGNTRNSSALGALTDTIDRQLGGMLDRIDVAASAQPVTRARETPLANNVVALAATGRHAAVQKPASGEVAPSSWQAQGELELSLEPIIAVSQSAAACFEVYANLPFADGVARPVRRLHGDTAPADRARFEAALVKATMLAGRRQLPGEAARLPLHVAISGTLLADVDQTADIAQLFELHPGLAAGVVLSLPAELLAGPTRGQQKSLHSLTETGVRLAAEGWPDIADAAALLAESGAGMLKLTCNRLLDRDKVKRKALAGSDLAEAAHAGGLTIIATDVATDEDAVALLDLGIDLMSGVRFSPPRRLRAVYPQHPGKIAEG